MARGKIWTPAEDAELHARPRWIPWRVVAQELGRTERATRFRASKIGAPMPRAEFENGATAPRGPRMATCSYCMQEFRQPHGSATMCSDDCTALANAQCPTCRRPVGAREVLDGTARCLWCETSWPAPAEGAHVVRALQRRLADY